MATILTPAPIHQPIVGAANPIQLPSYKAKSFLIINPKQNAADIIIGRVNADGSLPTGAQTHTSAMTMYPLSAGGSVTHCGSLGSPAWLDLSDLWAYSASSVELIIIPAAERTV